MTAHVKVARSWTAPTIQSSLLRLSAQLGSVGCGHAVLRSADVAANAILVHGIDDQFVSRAVPSGKERDRSVREATFFFNHLVVDENSHVIALLLHIGLLQLEQDLASDSLHVLALADVKLEVVAFTELPQFGDFSRVAGDAGSKFRASAVQIGTDCK